MLGGIVARKEGWLCWCDFEGRGLELVGRKSTAAAQQKWLLPKITIVLRRIWGVKDYGRCGGGGDAQMMMWVAE